MVGPCGVAARGAVAMENEMKKSSFYPATRRGRETPEQRAAREHGQQLFELMQAMPVEDEPFKPSQLDLEASAWAARLIILRLLGFNSRAETIAELQTEWQTRLALLPTDERVLNHDVRRLRSVLRAAWIEYAASWAGRRLGGKPITFAVELPDYFEHGRRWWGPCIDEQLVRHADEHTRLATLIRVDTGMEELSRTVSLRGGDRLAGLFLRQTVTAGAYSDARVEARHPNPWFCRICGDHGCTAHCPRSMLGKHKAEAREGGVACERCELQGAGSVHAPSWPSIEGDPSIWASSRPPTADELATEQQRVEIEAWMDGLLDEVAS